MKEAEVNEATTFLSNLFWSDDAASEFSRHRIGIFTLPAKAGGFFSCARDAVAFARAQEESGGGNVYFRTCPISEDAAAGLGPGERGAAAQSSMMCGVWADIDFGGDGAKKAYPPDEQRAMEVLERMGKHLRPTVIIHSGHGLQAWWLFDEPWVLVGGGEVGDMSAAAELSASWVGLVRMHAKAAGGWTVDSVGDLARVMRLPGFVNRKREPHVPVRVIEADYSRRFSRSDLMTECSGVGAGDGSVGGGVTDGYSVGEVDENSRADEEKKIRLFQFEPLCADSYFRKRADKPAWSDSEYDMSLAHYAIHTGKWTDEETAKLIIESRRRAGVLDKFFEGGKFSTRKLLMVIAKVRAGAGEEQVEGASQEAAIRNLVSPDAKGPSDREEGIALLSRALGVDLWGITKFSGDTHSYMIQTGKGRVSGLVVDDLINQTRFAKRMAETDGVVIPEFKKKEWAKMAQVILDVVIEKINESDDEVAELWSLWDDFIACRRRHLVRLEIKAGSKDDYLVFDKDLGTSSQGIGYTAADSHGSCRYYVTKSQLLQHSVTGGFELNRKNMTRMALRAGWKSVRARVGGCKSRLFEVVYPSVDSQISQKPEEISKSETQVTAVI